MRINIYVPNDLAEQVKSVHGLNVSQVCQEALREAVTPAYDYRLRCPHCRIGELWVAQHFEVQCIQSDSGGAIGCGAAWDAVGMPIGGAR